MRPETIGRRIARAVVDDDDLELGGRLLPVERLQDLHERVGAAMRRDDDGKRGQAAPPTKISSRVVRTSSGARARNSRKNSDSKRWSPG